MNKQDEDEPVNFDLDRMKASIESGYITIPNGLTREELREFLMNSAKEIKERGR